MAAWYLPGGGPVVWRRCVLHEAPPSRQVAAHLPADLLVEDHVHEEDGHSCTITCHCQWWLAYCVLQKVIFVNKERFLLSTAWRVDKGMKKSINYGGDMVVTPQIKMKALLEKYWVKACKEGGQKFKTWLFTKLNYFAVDKTNSVIACIKIPQEDDS